MVWRIEQLHVGNITKLEGDRVLGEVTLALATGEEPDPIIHVATIRLRITQSADATLAKVHQSLLEATGEYLRNAARMLPPAGQSSAPAPTV